MTPLDREELLLRKRVMLDWLDELAFRMAAPWGKADLARQMAEMFGVTLTRDDVASTRIRIINHWGTDEDER